MVEPALPRGSPGVQEEIVMPFGPYRSAMTDRTSGLQAISPAMMPRIAVTNEPSPSFLDTYPQAPAFIELDDSAEELLGITRLVAEMPWSMLAGQ